MAKLPPQPFQLLLMFEFGMGFFYECSLCDTRRAWPLCYSSDAQHQEQQSTARAESASEAHKGGWDEFRTWNRMGADHVNIASEA